MNLDNRIRAYVDAEKINRRMRRKRFIRKVKHNVVRYALFVLFVLFGE